MKLQIFSLLSIFFIFSLTGVVNAQEPCINCPTIPGEVDLSYILKWKQIPDIINQGQAGTLVIVGKLPNFTWSVSGQGFWFDAQHSTKTIENTAAQTVSLYCDSTACGTATVTVTDNNNHSILGVIVSNGGHWEPNYILVDAAFDHESCPGGIGDDCWFNSGTNYNICDGASRQYDYYIYTCNPWSAYGCEPPGCGGNPQPTCNNLNQACSLTVSDGICTYTSIATGCKGHNVLKLYRREWVCD